MNRYPLIAAIVLHSAAASAEGLEVWKDAGDWLVLIQSVEAGSCVAWKQFDHGLTVEIGTPPGMTGGYFAAHNPAWTTIEDGATGMVSFDFADAKLSGEAIGVYRNGVPGGQVVIDGPAFASEIGASQSVVVTGASGNQFEVDLSGSSGAIEAVIACQKELL